MGEAGRARATKLFSHARLVDDMDELYHSRLLAKRGGQGALRGIAR